LLIGGVCICDSADPAASPAAGCGGVAPAAVSWPAATSGLSGSAAGRETCPAAKGDGADPTAPSGEGDPLLGDGVAALTEAEGGESEPTGKLRTHDVRGARHDCGDPLPCWAGDLGEDAAEPAWDEASLTCSTMDLCGFQSIVELRAAMRAMIGCEAASGQVRARVGTRAGISIRVTETVLRDPRGCEAPARLQVKFGLGIQLRRVRKAKSARAQQKA